MVLARNTRVIILCSALLLIAITPHARAFHHPKCTAFFSLSGLDHALFQSTVATLAPHLKRKQIVLYDLNHWQDFPSDSHLSGRLRAQIREQFALDYNSSAAIVVDNHQNIILEQRGRVDLVEMLMACE
ncbi:hypothetical protein OE749_08175 [Aestuariibacter sp. AA17]|uniref:Uncharacterized protein n=1 Tax=Fluctibacter corallii TaxID=2984329 RepID=A0ABT3A7L4_9ALTE|nr:hypothetical protein [Aestuariibacter sp. AA17]MCV2884670.1 hypothetical protein [Aestuariibacter sp. AA17]